MPVYIIRCWHLVLDAHYYIILDAYLFGALSNIICFTASLKPDPQNTQKAQKVTSNRFFNRNQRMILIQRFILPCLPRPCTLKPVNLYTYGAKSRARTEYRCNSNVYGVLDFKGGRFGRARAAGPGSGRCRYFYTLQPESPQT